VSLQISIRERGDVSIVDLEGKSTIGGGSELLSKCLRDLAAGGKRKVLLNLANVIHMDSSGIGIIVETLVSLRHLNGELKLLSPRGRVLQVLTTFRLLEAIPRFDDETQALLSFGS
jgi:anti-sigma B factor antagonist